MTFPIESSTLRQIVYDLEERTFALQLGPGVNLTDGAIHAFGVAESYYEVEIFINGINRIKLWSDMIQGNYNLSTTEMITNIINSYETHTDKIFQYSIRWNIPSNITFDQKYVIHQLYSQSCDVVTFHHADASYIELELKDLEQLVTGDYLTILAQYEQSNTPIISVIAEFNLYDQFLGG